jgi:hypothetical protein
VSNKLFHFGLKIQSIHQVGVEGSVELYFNKISLKKDYIIGLTLHRGTEDKTKRITQILGKTKLSNTDRF